MQDMTVNIISVFLFDHKNQIKATMQKRIPVTENIPAVPLPALIQ